MTVNVNVHGGSLEQQQCAVLKLDLAESNSRVANAIPSARYLLFLVQSLTAIRRHRHVSVVVWSFQLILFTAVQVSVRKTLKSCNIIEVLKTADTKKIKPSVSVPIVQRGDMFCFLRQELKLL